MISSGIIPALAGNTAPGSREQRSQQDHPRSRGEYQLFRRRAGEGTGSSPLSRGIRPCWPRTSCRRRIIPALAGNTKETIRTVDTSTDHPRSRGEYGLARSPIRSPRGSSPLSRGIHELPAGRGVFAGIIPALAGNTEAGSGLVGAPSDHPRSRGEYSPRSVARIWKGGSSPLSRGILGCGCAIRWGAGIIPALAGNTNSMPSRISLTSDHPRSRGEYSSACLNGPK